MKKLALSVIFFFIFCSISDAQEPLKFARIVNTPDQMVGAKILNAGYKRLGIPIEIVEMPGKRALLESSRGRIDGEVHRIFRVGDDYPALIRIPTPINYIEPTAFAKNLKLTVGGCSDLKTHRVGIVRGVKHAEECTQGMENVQVVNSSKLLMQILHRDRVDVVITARVNGLHQLKELNLEGIHALSPPLGREPVYHYLHKKHEALVPKIDGVFKEMQKDGTLEKLRAQFVGELLQR
ncbi:MAG: amino acid ABC transporter substrate-binding protein [Deltaproteobacteria bacterium]|nr:amino acid ABC transporter substrate-binding protein [Deltaproteobacteria bacterium]